MYSDSFRWMDSNGFEHLTRVDSEVWEGGMNLILEAVTSDILREGGRPLVSNNLRDPHAKLEQAEGREEVRTVPDRETGEDIELPKDVHIFHVKEVYRDTAPNSTKSHMKVVIEEQDYKYANGNYGIACFQPESHFPKWASWEVGKRKSPPEGAELVLVRDPESGSGSKRAVVVEFRAE